MNPYALTLAALLVAFLAQSLATGLLAEAALRTPRQRARLALALGFGLLALHHAETLELGLRTGLYDLRQGLIAAAAAILCALGAWGVRAVRETPPPPSPANPAADRGAGD